MKARPAMCISMALFLRVEPSQAFAPWLVRTIGPSAQDCRVPAQSSSQQAASRGLKRQRPRRQATPAAEEGGWEGSLMELDVVEYCRGDDEGMELASYIGDGKLQPLLTREEYGPNMFFHDEDAQPVSVSSGCRIVRVIDEIYYSQRVVEDRVKNPHGEEAEDCFLLEGTLNPATVIRVEHSQDGRWED